jgi:hypothetical protein
MPIYSSDVEKFIRAAKDLPDAIREHGRSIERAAAALAAALAARPGPDSSGGDR